MASKKVERQEDVTPIFLTGSICVSNIPESAYFIASNGKKYVNITVSNLEALNEYNGRITSHCVKYSPSREDRERGKTAIELGKVSEWKNDGSKTSPKEESTPKPKTSKRESEPVIKHKNEIDDLPF